MAISCPADFDAQALRAEVSKIYGRVALDPDGDFHFHRGPVYAAAMLGYDEASLSELPGPSTASFAGVANPLAIAEVLPGQKVLDVGCGAGMDLLLAARLVGARGEAIGVDMTSEMLESVKRSAEALDDVHVVLKRGDAEALPLEAESVDVVISNGVLNLTTDKHRAFSEIHRVLKPGGRLLLGDIAVADELSLDIRNDIDLWTG